MDGNYVALIVTLVVWVGLFMFLRRLDYLRKTLAVQSLFVLDGSGAAPYGDISHGWFKTPPTPETLNAGAQDDTGQGTPPGEVTDRD